MIDRDDYCLFRLMEVIFWWPIKLAFQITIWFVVKFVSLLFTKFGAIVIGIWLLLVVLESLISQPISVPTIPGLGPTPPTEITTLRILYTNDEEGFLLPSQCRDTGGAVGIVQAWAEHEDCTDENCLILSGGDIFMSSPISSVFRGHSTVEVMNAMGYDALGVGNHELDFGKEHVENLQILSDFPFLSANYMSESQRLFPAYEIVQRQGIHIGIVGLSTQDTTKLSNRDLLNHQAVEYQNALETVLGEIVGRTDVLVLIGNVSPDDLQSIDAGLRNQFIVLLGGDDEQPYPSDKVGQSTGTPFSENGQILEAHAHWSGYIRVDLQIELSTGQFVEGEYQFFQNQYSRSADEVLAQQQRDPQVQQTIDIVQRWHEDLRATDDDYARNVLQDASYVNSPIAQINNVTYGRDIVRGWYDIYEQTDIAVFNTGGFRGCLDPGPVYISDVRGILPFDNSLELLEVRGAILRSLYHTQSALIIEGIQESNGEIQIIKRDGAIEQLQDDGSYLVLTNTFLAKGGDGVPFKEEQRVETLASDWKVAAMEWFMAHEQQSN